MGDQQNDGQKLSFCCSDLGQNDCDWQTSGDNQDDLVRSIEEHARHHHNMVIDEDTDRRIRDALGKSAA